MDNITVVIITYKSEKKVFDLINKIPKNIKIIVIENSENHKLKEKIKNEYKNAKVVTQERMYLETMEKVLADIDKVIIEKNAGSGVVPYLPLPELKKKATN